MACKNGGENANTKKGMTAYLRQKCLKDSRIKKKDADDDGGLVSAEEGKDKISHGPRAHSGPLNNNKRPGCLDHRRRLLPVFSCRSELSPQSGHRTDIFIFFILLHPAHITSGVPAAGEIVPLAFLFILYFFRC